MIIMSSENTGQLGGFVEVKDLAMYKEYVIMDTLYMERGLIKVDETRIKDKQIMMFADKWGGRPWSFTYAKGLCLDQETEIIGNVNILIGFYCILMEKEFANIEPTVTVLFVNNVNVVNDFMDVTVVDKFHYGSMKAYVRTHAQGRVIELARDMLTINEIKPNISELFRRELTKA